MKCPHCLENFHDNWEPTALSLEGDWNWFVHWCKCPSCGRIVIKLSHNKFGTRLVQPKAISRGGLPPEVVDQSLRNDYEEACLVLADSPKASAALSRRALQYILRNKAGVKPSKLSSEIDEVLESHALPSDLSEHLDYIREVGNFAAHPTKSETSGEILEVEPGEAEWNLDVLEALMDFYYVRPARMAKKRDALNEKLKNAGRSQI